MCAGLFRQKWGEWILRENIENKGSGLAFREILLLILIGAAAFVGLSHLDIVGTKIWAVVSLFMPLIVGGVIGFILNVPMHFFEKQCDRLCSRKGLHFLGRVADEFVRV